MNEIIVQSVAMEESFRQCYPEYKHTPVSVMPFLPRQMDVLKKPSASQSEVHTFIYVASADAHKNHMRLIHAWERLASQGVFPTLLLTLDDQIDKSLIAEIERVRLRTGARITNLGRLSGEALDGAYCSASAAIFPSYSESFGIPLYEALSYRLPILASETDFVRDATNPVESFNPFSERSIADAVLRYMGVEKPKKAPVAEEEFCLSL